MRFFHISDLHIGKRVNGFSMVEDQRWILNQILELAKEERPDGILIAGDLYDKPVPSAEAVELLDEFLYGFVRLGIPVWAISGNHDSAERVAYGARMMERSGIFLSRAFDGTAQKYTATGRDGERVDIYLLPFLKPAAVRRFFPGREIETTQQAVEAALETVCLEEDRVNILLTHQFLTGASTCESEELSVGGSDQVDASVVERFDYVALGHLHGPQRVGRETIRYCGSPLKYSFSEASHRKSVTVVEIGEERSRMEAYGESKAPEVQIEERALSKQRDVFDTRKVIWEEDRAGGRKVRIGTIPLVPLRDLREIRGPLEELVKPEVAGAADAGDYLHVTLTDQGEILDAIGKLRAVYPNIMRLDFERRDAGQIREEEIRLEEKTPQELFAEFYEKQNGVPLSGEQEKLVNEIWKRTAGAAEVPSESEGSGEKQRGEAAE